MGAKTKIGWTDHTHNLWWGCDHHGPGCQNCYAEAWAKRTGHDVWGHDAPRRFFGEKHMAEPLRWNKQAVKDGVRRRVFCMSMGDIAERLRGPVGDRMNQERGKLWDIIGQTPMLDWLLLTKLPQNLPAIVPANWMRDGFPSNVWVGTSGENQEWFDKRVKYLLRVPARIRFVSFEPLLGRVNAAEYLPLHPAVRAVAHHLRTNHACSGGGAEARCAVCNLEFSDAPTIHWGIVGSESGGKARPMNIECAESLRDQFVDSGTAFFTKQIATPKGRLMKDYKGEDPRWWPPGEWPREWPLEAVAA